MVILSISPYMLKGLYHDREQRSRFFESFDVSFCLFPKQISLELMNFKTT